MNRLTTQFWTGALVLGGVALFVLSLLLGEEPGNPEDPDSFLTDRLMYVPPLPVPPDNPLTPQKIELGRRLFYEEDLSVNGSIACATCHEQARAFTDGRAHSAGATGELTRRNAMSLTNVAYNGVLTWASDTVVTLEQQALMPLTLEHPVEMGILGKEETVLARLAAEDDYRKQFADAFLASNPAITLDNVLLALASFERTLLSYDSPYDRFLAGDEDALSAEAQRGRVLFFSPGFNCSRCHDGHNFRFTPGTRQGEDDTSVAFHNTGLYNIDGQGGLPPEDRGLLEVTGRPEDMGRFKAPTLRNIALTAPYMHDGSVETLEDVLRHYARGGRMIEEGPYAGDGRQSPLKSELIGGFELPPDDLAALLAFLESLTDEHFVTRNDLADPG
ncbi:di-heme enzyme [Mangrovimicrobium sediminis]|uniref:Di-heme enzyme n=1 Tax=Mangrovimicrobium sediminis TaxID=2562682 RepID=A0A4Z0M9D4_9GAMM|nr:methanobactin export MATE transporter MbnM [Haliea sp. SAOS-164]TGD76010.1 di-heme enzyme [Haliea sp. SAOS-164]